MQGRDKHLPQELVVEALPVRVLAALRRCAILPAAALHAMLLTSTGSHGGLSGVSA